MPVAGDLVYGKGRGARRAKDEIGLERQFLHAWRLSFERPDGTRVIALEAPLPADLKQRLDVLRSQMVGDVRRTGVAD